MNNCDKDICPGGNCIGCENYTTWCQDPRCVPYCSGCEPPQDYNVIVNILFVVLIIILSVIIFVYWFVSYNRSRN